MPKTGLILPRGRATQYPLFVARAESYWRDRGLVFGADYSAGNRRDLVTGALPTATSTIGGNTALGPGVKTDGTRTGLTYATPPGLPTPFTAISLVLVVDPSNATTGTTLYLAAVGATSGDPDWSILLDTTNLGYGILENSFLRAANGTAVLGKTAILMATMSGSARALYADGVLIASDTGGGSRTGGVLGIGRQGAGTGSHASGVISAAMVFNRALSASEVTDLTMRLRQHAPTRFQPQYVGGSAAPPPTTVVERRTFGAIGRVGTRRAS